MYRHAMAPLSKRILCSYELSFQRIVECMGSIHGTEGEEENPDKNLYWIGYPSYTPTHVDTQTQEHSIYGSFKCFVLYILSLHQVYHNLIYNTSSHRKKIMPLNFWTEYYIFALG